MAPRPSSFQSAVVVQHHCSHVSAESSAVLGALVSPETCTQAPLKLHSHKQLMLIVEHEKGAAAGWSSRSSGASGAPAPFLELPSRIGCR